MLTLRFTARAFYWVLFSRVFLDWWFLSRAYRGAGHVFPVTGHFPAFDNGCSISRPYRALTLRLVETTVFNETGVRLKWVPL